MERRDYTEWTKKYIAPVQPPIKQYIISDKSGAVEKIINKINSTLKSIRVPIPNGWLDQFHLVCPKGGIILKINPNKVPRIIGRGGSMINLIKAHCDCDIIVGQNGIIWIKGKSVEEELFGKEAILFVTEKSFVDGLTEKTEKWLESKSKKSTKKVNKVNKPNEIKDKIYENPYLRQTSDGMRSYIGEAY